MVRKLSLNDLKRKKLRKKVFELIDEANNILRKVNTIQRELSYSKRYEVRTK